MKAGRKKAAKEDQWCDESLTPHLPNHLLTEIFCRLPIKTLMAVKCVSKSCLELVSADTHFAKLHRHRSPTELLLRSSDKLDLGTLQFLNNTVSGLKRSLLFYLRDLNNVIGDDFKGELVFVNSCNGLVCFQNFRYSRGDLIYAVICNPVTGEYITVDCKTAQGLCSCGLGFSRKENRYKLLRITLTWYELHNPTLIADIWTLENGSLWRNLRSFPYWTCPTVFNFPYVFLEGKLHFQCAPDLEEYIDCFDFDNEQFGKVPLPPPYDSDYTKNCIRELGGCLSVTRFGSSGDCIETWVMKKYGVKDSWIKAFSVAKLPIYHRELMYPANGEALIVHDGITLVVYNSVINTMRNQGRDHDSLQVIAYTPTLLRLKDVLAGYEACVQRANSRSADLGVIP